MIDLSGKVAVVTGGTGGIGCEICRVFSELGARHIVVADLRPGPSDGAPPIDEAIRNEGGSASFVECDVTDSKMVGGALRGVLSEHGGLDILVNSAGVLFEGDALATSDTDWRRVISINLDGTFYASREAVRLMRELGRPGKIVNLASISGLRGHVDATAYGASKGGVISLTRHMGLDFAGDGINVNAVAPGYVETAMTAQYSGEDKRRRQAMFPAGRWATAREIAAAVAFLASPLSDFICGQTIAVDGGWTIGNPKPR